jgi:hypothetical protein
MRQLLLWHPTWDVRKGQPVLHLDTCVNTCVDRQLASVRMVRNMWSCLTWPKTWLKDPSATKCTFCLGGGRGCNHDHLISVCGRLVGVVVGGVRRPAVVSSGQWVLLPCSPSQSTGAICCLLIMNTWAGTAACTQCALTYCTPGTVAVTMSCDTGLQGMAGCACALLVLSLGSSVFFNSLAFMDAPVRHPWQ